MNRFVIFCSVAVAILSVAILFLLPLNGHDSYFQVNNVAQYYEILSQGEIPRWCVGSFNGFGSALFYFYPPACSFFGSLLHATGLPIGFSIRVMLLLAIIFATATASWYLSLFSIDRTKRWTLAVLYSLSPYAVLDLFIRGAYGEFFTLPWIPLILGGIECARRGNKMSSALLICVGLSMVVLSSIPVAATLLLIVPAYAAVRLYRVQIGKIVFALFGAILAVMCTAFYWLPVISMRGLVHLDHVINASGFTTSVFLNFTKEVVGKGVLIESYLLSVCAILAVLWFFYYRRSQTSFALAWAAVLGLVIFSHVPALTDIIAHVLPVFGIIQYPIRFYLVVGLSLGLWIGVGEVSSQWAKMAIIVNTIGVIAIILSNVMESQKAVDPVIERKLSKSTYEYAPIQTPGNGDEVVHYGSLHADDPMFALDRPTASDQISVIRDKEYSKTLLVSLEKSGQARVHYFYWPFWRFTASTGREIPVTTDQNGVLLITLPAGKYMVLMQLEHSRSEIVGDIISIAAGLVFLFSLLVVIRSKYSPQALV